MHGNFVCTGGNDGDEESTIIDVSRSAVQPLPPVGNRCSPERTPFLLNAHPLLPEEGDATLPNNLIAHESNVTLTDISDNDLTFVTESQDSKVCNLPSNGIDRGENEQSFASTVSLSPLSTTSDKENLFR